MKRVTVAFLFFLSLLAVMPVSAQEPTPTPTPVPTRRSAEDLGVGAWDMGPVDLNGTPVSLTDQAAKEAAETAGKAAETQRQQAAATATAQAERVKKTQDAVEQGVTAGATAVGGAKKKVSPRGTPQPTAEAWSSPKRVDQGDDDNGEPGWFDFPPKTPLGWVWEILAVLVVLAVLVLGLYLLGVI